MRLDNERESDNVEDRRGGSRFPIRERRFKPLQYLRGGAVVRALEL